MAHWIYRWLISLSELMAAEIFNTVIRQRNWQKIKRLEEG